MEPKIGIETNHQHGSVKMLSKHLADEMILYIKTLNYHWNVRGVHFGPLHKLFKKQYEKLSSWIDEIAERIRTVGGDAPGTMKEFIEIAGLKEHPGVRPTEKEMLKNLLDDQEAIIRSFRKGIDISQDEFHDAGTSDFLTALLEGHEQMAWMTRAHLEK